jgi:hypothetical protein
MADNPYWDGKIHKAVKFGDSFDPRTRRWLSIRNKPPVAEGQITILAAGNPSGRVHNRLMSQEQVHRLSIDNQKCVEFFEGRHPYALLADQFEVVWLVRNRPIPIFAYDL